MRRRPSCLRPSSSRRGGGGGGGGHRVDVDVKQRLGVEPEFVQGTGRVRRRGLRQGTHGCCVHGCMCSYVPAGFR